VTTKGITLKKKKQIRNTHLRKTQKINKKAPRRARRKSLPFWVTPKASNPRSPSRKKTSLRGRRRVCVKLKLRLDILARWWGVIGQIAVGAEVGTRVRKQMAKNLHHCSKITGPVLLLGHHIVPYPFVVPVVVMVTHLSLLSLSLTFKDREPLLVSFS
jgi:hypothetical protein